MPHSNQCSIAIMAKAPVPGYCKTRLNPHIGPLAAAKLQQQLLVKTVETAIASNLGDVTLWCAPDSRHFAFSQARSRYGVSLKKQLGNNLGQRMLSAIQRGLKHNEKVIVIGTDCPALTITDLHSASEQLNTVDHVFQPASDGGYVLVGSRHYLTSIFSRIPWGGSGVMSATRRRLQQGRLSYSESPMSWDLDDIKDLHKAKKANLLT